MPNYKLLGIDNLDLFYPERTAGKYGIPQIQGVSDIDMPDKWIPFNHAVSCEKREGKGLHFFINDYQFVRAWNKPEAYLPLLKGFKYVLAPDFSTYADAPLAVQINSHYKKHWCAAFWQQNGVNVIPVISWSDYRSFDWCFDGEPAESVVAVSTVGVERNRASMELFVQGWTETLERLKPSRVICYGKQFGFMRGNITVIEPFYKSVVERRKRKEGLI